MKTSQTTKTPFLNNNFIKDPSPKKKKSLASYYVAHIKRQRLIQAASVTEDYFGLPGPPGASLRLLLSLYSWNSGCQKGRSCTSSSRWTPTTSSTFQGPVQSQKTLHLQGKSTSGKHFSVPVLQTLPQRNDLKTVNDRTRMMGLSFRAKTAMLSWASSVTSAGYQQERPTQTQRWATISPVSGKSCTNDFLQPQIYYYKVTTNNE